MMSIHKEEQDYEREMNCISLQDRYARLEAENEILHQQAKTLRKLFQLYEKMSIFDRGRLPPAMMNVFEKERTRIDENMKV